MRPPDYRVIGASIPPAMLALPSMTLARDVAARYRCGIRRAKHAIEYARGECK